MEASSAINTPHTDDPEPGAFFDPPAAQAEPEPTPEADPAEATPEPAQSPPEASTAPQADTEPEGQPASAEAPAEEAKPGGTLAREYIVFHKVVLGAEQLRNLAKDIEKGVIAAVTTYVELHREVARNDKLAVAGAYARHGQRIGDRAELAAVSSRSFKERHVEPEEVPAERRVKIT